MATYSTNGDDTLTGTAGADSIDGLLGNDALLGLAGDDWLRGSGGNEIGNDEEAAHERSRQAARSRRMLSRAAVARSASAVMRCVSRA